MGLAEGVAKPARHPVEDAALPPTPEPGTQPRLRSAAGAGGAGLHPVRQRGMGEDLAAKAREEEGVKVCKTRMR